MKLSVALATFNEEEMLPDCLKSIADWTDEIVIADGSSTDKTREIAREYNARVFTYDNPQVFHINKQRAIEKCKGKWILQLDADERISPDLKKEILETIKEKSDINGYWIPRKNYFLGRFLTKGGQYPDYTMRLYKKDKGRLPGKDVHEQAVVDGEVGYLKAPLLHYADPNFKRYMVRFKRYTNLLARQFAEKQVKKNVFAFIFYVFIKPFWWFLKTYVRHKGFIDGWQGFVFSLFSGLRFPVAYLTYLIRHE